MGALLSDVQIVYGELQACSGTDGPDPGSSAPCEGVSGNPGDWALSTSLDCSKVMIDVSPLRSVGPIPLAQAQPWWSSALQNLTLGCSAIGLAQKGWLADSASGGTTAVVTEPGDVAATDMETASALLRRVDRTVSASS